MTTSSLLTKHYNEEVKRLIDVWENSLPISSSVTLIIFREDTP